MTPMRAAIVILSDKAAAGVREDLSGPAIAEALSGEAVITETVILPDEQPIIEAELRRIADSGRADVIFTSGGTGFSPTDRTPEATLAVGERLVPGIPEAIRAHSLAITPRAMLSRGVAVIRRRTLIINLPGSPKAVRESLEPLLPALAHAVETLRGEAYECARPQ